MDIGSVGNAAAAAHWGSNKGASGTETAVTGDKHGVVPAQTAPPPPQASQTVNASQVAEAVESINKTMQTLARDLEFSVDTDSNRTIVKVIDKQSGEVLRQMPSKEALEIAKALDRVQGLLIRQKA